MLKILRRTNPVLTELVQRWRRGDDNYRRAPGGVRATSRVFLPPCPFHLDSTLFCLTLLLIYSRAASRSASNGRSCSTTSAWVTNRRCCDEAGSVTALQVASSHRAHAACNDDDDDDDDDDDVSSLWGTCCGAAAAALSGGAGDGNGAADLALAGNARTSRKARSIAAAGVEIPLKTVSLPVPGYSTALDSTVDPAKCQGRSALRPGSGSKQPVLLYVYCRRTDRTARPLPAGEVSGGRLFHADCGFEAVAVHLDARLAPLPRKDPGVRCCLGARGVDRGAVVNVDLLGTKVALGAVARDKARWLHATHPAVSQVGVCTREATAGKLKGPQQHQC